MMKWLGRVWCVVNVVFMLWLAVSWVDIVADNCQPFPDHSQYNAFVVLTEFAENNKNKIEKGVDKQPLSCYNKYNIKERNTERGK